MSWFTPEELPNNRYYIFGKDGGVEVARKHGLKLLAQIPVIQSVMDGGESGTPAALKNDTIYALFSDIAVHL